MAEEKPANFSDHIYLDVIHVASRPASKKSLCPANNEPLREKPAVAKTTPTEKRQKPSNVATVLLVATIILLSAACCALSALYVIERSHNAMLSSQKNAKYKTSTTSTNCTSTVNRAPPGESLDCNGMESDLAQRKHAYQKMCSNRLGEVEVSSTSTTTSTSTTPSTSTTTSTSTTPSTTTTTTTTTTAAVPKQNQNNVKDCSIESIKFQSTADTVTSRGGTAMASATVCFWSKSSPGVVTYVVYIEPNNGPGFKIFEEKSAARTTDPNWHSFCFTWTTGEEQFTFYKDGQRLRGGEISRERRMTAGGTWVLGLASDKPGGEPRGTEIKRPGEITAVNVWNKVLPKKERAEIMASCVSRYKGNVKSWRDFTTNVKGNVKLVKSNCCNK